MFWDNETLDYNHIYIISCEQQNNHIAGVNFMEKTISIRGTEITFSIWDLGGVFDAMRANEVLHVLHVRAHSFVLGYLLRSFEDCCSSFCWIPFSITIVCFLYNY